MNIHKIIVFFILSNSVMAMTDKIFLKSGDVLKMNVERLDYGFAYLSDSLNRVKLKASLIEHIEYNKPTQVKYKKKVQAREIMQNNKWHISHYTEDTVYLYNVDSKKIKLVARKDVDSDSLHATLPSLWGVFAYYGFFNPAADLQDRLNTGNVFGIAASHKRPYQLSFLRYFLSVEAAYGKSDAKLPNQGITIFYVPLSINLTILANEYLRTYIKLGGGPTILTTFNSSQSQSDFTAMAAAYWGLEVFVLPYWSVKAEVGYSMFFQQDIANSVQGMQITLSSGYYLL